MERKIKLSSHEQAQELSGPRDENLRLIEKEFKVKLALRGEYLKVTGSVNSISRAASFIKEIIGNGGDVKSLGGPGLRALARGYKQDPASLSVHHAGAAHGAKAIGPKTKGQREYYEAIKAFDIVFGVGPAGTGKTYLAMACAVDALKNQEVRRIILTRPAIEAGESLGFLPGDMYEKISPYLRPLYDALYDMMEAERIEKYLETGTIEVAPLAYMRGRTLNEAFIVLDEAQNATPEQMKMFLTRLGFDSKAVITGDITQSDLPGGRPIGLMQAMETLGGIDGIKFVRFTGEDVVRHELVQKIIEAYEKANSSSR